MIANEVMQILIPKYYRMWGDYGDPLVMMFERLYKTYPGMFARMFKKMRELRISLATMTNLIFLRLFTTSCSSGAQKALGRYFVSPPMPQIDIRVFQSWSPSCNWESYPCPWNSDISSI